MNQGSALEVLRVFLRLGLTSFGGPIAHLGYFREALVARRRWIDEPAFADLVALAQFLPGPASSQVGFALGLRRAGWRGGLAAWAGFTLPSALALLLVARGALLLRGPIASALTHGLELVAVAVVAQAVWGMARSLCPDRQRAGIALAALLVVLAGAGSVRQLLAILAGGVLGLALCRQPAGQAAAPPARTPRSAWVALGLFALLLLVGLSTQALGGPARLQLFGAFARAGALVFGGGHVVLPLLREAVVTPGWVGEDAFLAGYGAAQAVPGPLFTFAAYLGALASPAPGLAGAVIALAGIFLPGLLAMAAALPHWERLRHLAWAQAGLRGLNAAVVGLLAAVLYDPIFTTAVRSRLDLGVAAAGFVALVAWRVAPVLVVLGGAAAGLLLG